jgi:hypothetical protein
METVQVVKVIQLPWSIRLDDCVTNVIKPTEGLMGRPRKSRLLKVLHEEDGNDRAQWQTHSHISLLIELAIEAEKGRSQDMTEESQGITFKLSTQEV